MINIGTNNANKQKQSETLIKMLTEKNTKTSLFHKRDQGTEQLVGITFNVYVKL